MIASPKHQTRMRGADAPPADASAADTVAQYAHELQAPLAIVFALCERLLDGERLDAVDADDVRGIRTAASSLLERAEQLLSTARLGSERPVLDVRRIDVAALVRRTVATFESVAAGRDQHLVLLTPARLEAEVDEEKLVTALSNLVVNALKFTPEGGLVRCTLSARRGRVRLEIADSGPGIPTDLRDAMFEPYRRAGGRAERGHGLGLAIVRELVELHGGAVTIGDAPEGGALLVLELPRAAARAEGHVRLPCPSGHVNARRAR
jgi:signal transduction histidine kinase